jgi:nicotinamidase-related amidase
MKKSLLLVDIQNDYFPGGAMALPGSPDAAEKAALLLRAFRHRGLPVVHIQHVSTRPKAAFFVPDTHGVAIHHAVAPLQGETVFQKGHPSAFRATPLLDHLRGQGITQLVIAGMMTQMCIDSTTRAAADLGFSCLLAHDACAAGALSFGGVAVSAQEVHAAFLAALHGAFAKVLSVEEIGRGL